MSVTPCFSIAILSTPRPKARPLYFSGSILQFINTIGLTMPQPKISNHSPFSDKISTSAYGSVNGKYEGRNLISISFPAYLYYTLSFSREYIYYLLSPVLVFLEIVFPQPICRVYLFSGL